MKEIRPQTPSNPDNWLHDGAQDWQRVFSKLVYLGKDAEPWEECTDEEKEEYEKSKEPNDKVEENIEQNV